MPLCAKCSLDIDATCTLNCAECKGLFHAECTRVVSFDNYKKLSVRKKAAWKCDACSPEALSSDSHDSRAEPEPTLAALMEAFNTLGKTLGSQVADVKTSVDVVQRQLEGVNNTIGVMQSTLNNLVGENEKRKEEYTKLIEENKELQEGVAVLQSQVREMEQYSRKDNIEIVGVPYSRGENIYSVLVRLAKVLRLDFDSKDVSVVHRLPPRERQEHPTIIAKFIRRDQKAAWVRAAREHRARLTAATLSDSWPSTSIYINDHLTPHFKMILGRAKRLVKEKRIAFAWSRDCRVFARKTTDPDCPPTLLRTLYDLDLLLK